MNCLHAMTPSAGCERWHIAYDPVFMTFMSDWYHIVRGGRRVPGDYIIRLAVTQSKAGTPPFRYKVDWPLAPTALSDRIQRVFNSASRAVCQLVAESIRQRAVACCSYEPAEIHVPYSQLAISCSPPDTISGSGGTVPFRRPLQ